MSTAGVLKLSYAIWAAVLVTGGLAGVANAFAHRDEGREKQWRAFKNGAIGGAAAGVIGTAAGAFSVGAVACGALATGAGGAVTKTLDSDYQVDQVVLSHERDILLATGLSAPGGAFGGAFAPTLPSATKAMSGGGDELTTLGLGISETASNGALTLFNELASTFQ